MLRRHVTPAVLAFCVMLTCCCLGRVLAGFETLLMCAVAASAAAGIVLLYVRLQAQPSRRAGVLLLSIASGFLLGLFSLTRMEQAPRAAFLPFPEGEVSGFTGVLAEDSSLTTKGDAMLRLSLKDAASRIRQVTATARGKVLVRVRGATGSHSDRWLRSSPPLCAWMP